MRRAALLLVTALGCFVDKTSGVNVEETVVSSVGSLLRGRRLPAVQTTIKASNFTAINELYVGDGPIRASDQFLQNIVSGETTTYTVTTDTDSSYAVSYFLASGVTENLQGLIIGLVEGTINQCASTTNLLSSNAFTTGSWTVPTQKAANGFLTLSSGVHQLTCCFFEASNVVMLSVVLDVVGGQGAPADISSLPSMFAVVDDVSSSITANDNLENSVPGTINATRYFEYVDTPTSNGLGPKTGKNSLGYLYAGELYRYRVEVGVSGHYQFGLTLKGAIPTDVALPNLKFHFVMGENTCVWSEVDDYYPAVTLTAWAGDPDFTLYLATNNVINLNVGENVVTMCVEYASYAEVGQLSMTVNNDILYRTVPVVSTGMILNNVWITVGTLLAAGLIVFALYAVYSRRTRKARQARSELPSPTRVPTVVLPADHDHH